MLNAQNVFDFLNQKRIIEKIEKINLYTEHDFTSTLDGNLWEAYKTADYYEICIKGSFEGFCIGGYCNSKIEGLQTEDLHELTKNLSVSQLNTLIEMILKTNNL